MTSRYRLSRHSLRTQLAVVGFAGMLFPIAVLIAVVFLTENETDTTVEAGATSAEEVESDESGVSVWVPVTAALLALPAGAVVWWWAGRAVEPIDRITAVADEIQAGSLDRRIALDGAPTEVQSLADSFDRMLNRLAAVSETQRQLVEDTSHELRTPLAALAANAEVMLSNPDPTLAEYRRSTERTEAIAERLQNTVDSLLADARSRGQVTRQVDNDLAAIALRVVDQQRTLTPELDIELRSPSQLMLGIDGPSVERAVANLVENAARHSPEDGTVTVELVDDGETVQLSVRDEGPGIDPDDAERIFDRYYRSSRGPGGGHGIGLALVKHVADSYGGVTVESPLAPDGGTEFTLTFRRLP